MAIPIEDGGTSENKTVGASCVQRNKLRKHVDLFSCLRSQSNYLHSRPLLHSGKGLKCTIFIIMVTFSPTNASCPVSRSTVRKVSSCPQSDTAWKVEAERKNCASVKQKCTDPTKFMYHCLVNTYRNETIEVCAPMAYISGYCCEFNIRGAVVQRNYAAGCRNFTIPCTDPYISYENYKFPECYILVTEKNQSSSHQSNFSTRDSSNTTENIETEREDGKETFLFPIYITVAVLILAAVPLYTFCICRCKGGSDMVMRKADDTEFEEIHIEADDDVDISPRLKKEKKWKKKKKKWKFSRI